ncbi:Ger(x)C family spore germination protein [Halobacillus kuroshimensis]|uniref:Ger(X)C family spore germination protein n=1 Tax=Halobacillus kuroshimensis TaxID=302481 RepID=A0ABS3E0S3_9BACI|nr:Ger(x)C family spore germination protein [Halobacillus kuroshimensis]MBN8237200.1 Ger(x)C family spore germination protein [Halobacillus kuroshimensis]
MRKCIFLIISLLLLAGCWDQENLSDRRLINGISFDLSEEDPNLIKGGVRALNITSQGGGTIEVKDELLTTVGATTGELGHEIKNYVPGRLDVTKTFIIFLGDELSKEGISPLLETFYRDNLGYLPAKVVVVKGEALEVLSINNDESPIAFRVLNGVRSAEKNTLLPKVTLFTLWNTMGDKRIDPVLPLVEKEEDLPKIIGLALFDQDKYTGKNLDTRQATLLMLMLDDLGFTADVFIPYEKNPQKMYRLSIMGLKRELNTKVSKDGTFTSTIALKIKTEINGNPLRDSDIKGMEVQADEVITKRMEEVLTILQEVHSDPLGIGMEIASKYPEEWKRLNWDKTYKEMGIKLDVEVDIEKKGGLL